ncbi:MAG: SpoIIE family protein phosphatase [Bacteroidales bacterium]|jgi:serine phosphatase RsbU (regulator of sigma subunit)|nr:SpoIIE family protein phosphatase [Bacteroidales bacterium]
MRRFIVLPILFSFVFIVSAQVNKYGTPLMKSYGMQITRGAEYNWAITKDKFGAVYFGNDDNMVIRYDGSKWTSITINQDNATIVRALGADQNGIIYVGGPNEFGYIEPDSSGTRVYVSLASRLSSAKDITSTAASDTLKSRTAVSDDFSIGNIASLIVKDSSVYFLSQRTLIIYNMYRESLSYINLRQLGYRQFVRIFSIADRILLSDNNDGIFEFRAGQIIQTPGGRFFSRKMCLTILPYRENEVIIATVEAGIFRYNYSSGSVDSTFIEKKVFNKLKEMRIYCGVKLITGEMVFGTMTDGIYVFNSNGQFTGHWTSQTTDMNDNVVSALYSDPDASSELWVATAGSVTKAYVNIPFTHISEKSGLDGSVNQFIKFNGSVYVSTDKGLFKSSVNEDGSRIFSQYSNISSQVFPLFVANVARDSFLLAGSNINGVYKINANGQATILQGDLINSRDEVYKAAFSSRSIFQSKVRKDRFYFGKAAQGLRILDYNNGIWKYYADVKLPVEITPYIFELENGDLIFLSNFPDGLYRLHLNDTIPIQYTSEKGIGDFSLNAITERGGNIYLSSGTGILKLNTENDTWIPSDEESGGYTKGKNIEFTFNDPDGDLWVSTIEDRCYDILFPKKNDTIEKIKGGSLALLPNIKFLYASTIDGRVWFAKSKSIYVIDKEKLRVKLPPVQTLLTKVVISFRGVDSLVMNETFYTTAQNGKRYPVSSNKGQKPPEFSYKYNSPSFYWTTPYMVQEEDILYSYKLEGYDNDWSKWDKISYKDYTNLPFGKYTFKVKARTATEIESHEAEYSFIILKPWYLTPWMIILYIIAAILSIFGIIVAYTRNLKNENLRLEGIVAERTAVVVKQKEELESSIHYASRIQMALLPSQAILSENIRNYFVLFKPRDIVSGDFYWMTKKGERLYVVAGDCTGHGVPGAFMSLLGMSFLDEIIDKEEAPRADFILNQMRLHVTDSLKQVGGDDEAKDGIDMALLVIDFNTRRIEFSGAYNPCFRVRKLTDSETRKYHEDSAEMPDGSMSNGKYLLETIYASKMPIGISSRMNEDFVFYDWNLEKGVSYYLFSDGYIDQFGGSHGRKFMKKNFKRLILDIQDFPMDKQKELLDKNLKDWMGQAPQIDDILVMGIRTE